jgi:fluoroquinolone transport system ATP-binding protein
LRIAHGRRFVRLEMMRDGARATREFALANLADDRGFLAELQAGGIETIHTLETTLEDVFVQVTGRTLA